MSKMIAIWGSPNSGKTTLAVKLAQHIYEKYNASVIILSTDDSTPALPVLFPNMKSTDLFSVGVPLSRTEILEQDVLKSIVTVKGKLNLGFAGFMDGENKYSYPGFDSRKAAALLLVLKNLVDIVIVDCTSSLDNLLSATAMKQSDAIIRLATPDLKSISFFSSQLPLLASLEHRAEKHIPVLNIPENDIYLPVGDAIAHYKDILFSVPYCRTVKEQIVSGELLKPVSSKKFNKALGLIAKKVV